MNMYEEEYNSFFKHKIFKILLAMKIEMVLTMIM